MSDNIIKKIDFVAVPSTDADRSIDFYTNVLGLEKDKKTKYEFWVDNTCFSIWEPEKMGMKFSPQKNAHIALHVDDIDAAKKELESKGVKFFGDPYDTGVCKMAMFTDPDGNDLMLHNNYTN